MQKKVTDEMVQAFERTVQTRAGTAEKFEVRRAAIAEAILAAPPKPKPKPKPRGKGAPKLEPKTTASSA